jgi:hypothetical protein
MAFQQEANRRRNLCQENENDINSLTDEFGFYHGNISEHFYNFVHVAANAYYAAVSNHSAL